jgi:hypothetical protein
MGMYDRAARLLGAASHLRETSGSAKRMSAPENAVSATVIDKIPKKSV